MNTRNYIRAAATFATLAAIAATTSAVDYTVNAARPWHLSRTGAPPNMAAHPGATAMSAYGLGTCTGSLCPHAGESGLIATAVAKTASGTVIAGWNYVTCRAVYNPAEDTTKYGMLFEASAASWPTSWPATLSCSAAELGNSVIATVPVTTALDSDWFGDPISTITIAAGVSITLPNVSGTKVASTAVRKNLPAGSYMTASVQAKKAGAVWPGVICSVKELGTIDTIDYSVGDAAVAGSGSCKIQMANGSFQTTPVVVVRP